MSCVIIIFPANYEATSSHTDFVVGVLLVGTVPVKTSSSMMRVFSAQRYLMKESVKKKIRKCLNTHSYILVKAMSDHLS